MAVLRSSHRRYSEYRAKLKERRRNKEADDGGSFHSTGPERKKKPLRRSSLVFKLFVLFWGCWRAPADACAGAGMTLGVSTLLGLIPLYGTKIVFDSAAEDPRRLRTGCTSRSTSFRDFPQRSVRRCSRPPGAADVRGRRDGAADRGRRAVRSVEPLAGDPYDQAGAGLGAQARVRSRRPAAAAPGL